MSVSTETNTENNFKSLKRKVFEQTKTNLRQVNCYVKTVNQCNGVLSSTFSTDDDFVSIFPDYAFFSNQRKKEMISNQVFLWLDTLIAVSEM